VNALLRPLLLFATLCAVVLALVTVAGRVLVTWIDDFEGEINALLSPRNVELRGLTATWHGLDPVLKVASLRFPGGHADNVTFELDLLESVWHSGLVARHLSADGVELMIIRSAQGQWLLGPAAPPGSGFDLMPLFVASDQLLLRRFDVTLAQSSGDQSDPLEVLARYAGSASIVNERPQHSGDVKVALVDPSCAACELSLQWRLSEKALGIDLQGVVKIDGDGFTVPVALGKALGGVSVRFETLSGRWDVVDGDGRGTLAVAARDIRLPGGSLDRIDLQLDARSELWHRDWFAQIKTLRVSAGSDATELAGIDLALRQGLSGSRVEFATAGFDVAPQVPLVRRALVDLPVAREWIDALAPRARVERLSGSYVLADRALSGVAVVDDLQLEGYKGVPMIRNGHARVVGNERGFQAHIEGRDVTVGLLDVYAAPTQFDQITADIELWFKDKFLVVRGSGMEARMNDTVARGAFSVSRPEDKQEQRISLWITADSVDALAARSFIPKKVSPELQQWLDRAVIAGTARDVGVVFYGHLRATEGLPMRQAELRFDVEGGALRFQDNWPLAAALDGRVTITALGLDAWLDRGMILGLEFAAVRVHSPRTGGYVDIDGKGRGNAADVRTLIDESPLIDALSFIRPDWRFSGPIDYSLSMRAPIRQGDISKILRVELDSMLNGVTVDTGSLGLMFSDLTGPVRYRYPYAVTSPGIRGRLFDQPALFDANFDAGRIAVGIDGRADVRAIGAWLAADPGDLAAGEFEFRGDFSVWPGTQRPPRLALASKLEGIAIDLPAPFAKPAGAVLPASIEVEIRDDGQFITGDVAQWAGFWARLPKTGVPAARISFNAPVPPEVPGLEAIVVGGGLEAVDLTDWVGRFGRSLGAGIDTATRGERPLRLEFKDFAIGRVDYRTLSFDEVTVNALLADGATDLSVSSAQIAGTLHVPVAGPIRLDLARLHLPAGEGDPSTDPLAGLDPGFISTAEVALRDIRLAEQSFGDWAFHLRRDGKVVYASDLKGSFRGLEVVATEPMMWVTGAEATSRFNGKVSGANLATVLPEFGYAPSVETKSVTAKADVTWPGSPLHFALGGLRGTLEVDAKQGRFVDVEGGSGTMRVFSLLNFTAIAKRMTLDFTDVFGKGVSFDELTARVALDAGSLEFIDPMVIDGTGAYFRVGGSVEFSTGQLDNDMVVTLPVSSSLPWYAAYLSFINPLAAGAVLVGERLFRNQIDQFSSATYKVTGTLDDPKVEFVRVFGRGPDAKPAATPTVTKEPPAAVDPGQNVPPPEEPS
jgi:uncharacterized protein (TIGR02099 family)